MIFRWLNKGRGHLSHDELSTFVDGGPDAPSDHRVQAHLATCDRTCAADLEALKATVAILRSVQPVEAPRSFALTAEMVADLPDGKPLGSPPPMQDVSAQGRIPVWAPAVGAAAAAVVFALVLVGNLTGTLEQGSSSSDDAAPVTFDSAAAGSTGGESAVEMPENATAPQAAASLAPQAGAPVNSQRTAGEPLPVAPESAVSGIEIAPPAVAADSSIEPEFPLADEVPQPLPEDGVKIEATDSDLLEPVEEIGPTLFAPADVTPDRQADSDVAQTTPLQIRGSEDGGGFPVWQVLLATGFAAITLGLLSVVTRRRQRV